MKGYIRSTVKSISEKEQLEDIFNKEEINNKGIVDFHKKMIS